LTRVLSPLGSFASAPVYFMLFLAATFLVVELIAVISSVKLTRSLTGTIHDIYAGTGKIETGDFSHRIPVRTKDQLSELATSFNSMTEHIERLIAEVDSWCGFTEALKPLGGYQPRSDNLDAALPAALIAHGTHTRSTE